MPAFPKVPVIKNIPRFKGPNVDIPPNAIHQPKVSQAYRIGKESLDKDPLLKDEPFKKKNVTGQKALAYPRL